MSWNRKSFWMVIATILISFNAYSHQIKKGFQSGELFFFYAEKLPLRDQNGNEAYLEEEAAQDFKELLAFATKEGYFLNLNFAFRDHQEQEYWYNRYQKKCKKDPFYCNLAAKPGHSTHQEGKSVDIKGCTRYFSNSEIKKKPLKTRRWIKKSCKKMSNGYSCRTILFWWLKNNASKFNFYNDVEGEPWHWTHSAKLEEVGG